MLRNRPVALLCLLFSGGVAAGLFLSFYYTIPIVFTLLFVIAIALWKFKKKSLALILALSFLCAGIICPILHTFFSYRPSIVTQQEYTVTLSITGVKSNAYGKTIQGNAVSGQFKGYGFRFYSNDARIVEGYTAVISGTVQEGGLKEKASGVDYIIDTPKVIGCGDKGAGLGAALLRARGLSSRFIYSTVNNNELAGFYSALFTGDASNLSTELNASFSRSGISHILVVSGQHFSLVIMNVYMLLMLTIRRKKLCSGIAIVLTILFTLFTGASPSVIRAAFMCCMVFIMNFATATSDSINSLFLSLAVILLFSPYSLLSISLQLSFLSTLGVIFAYKYIERFTHGSKLKTKLITLLVAPILFSFTASLFCIPVFLYAFDTVSVFAPLTNVLINSLLTPIFILGIPCLAIAKITGWEFTVSILYFFYSFIRYCSDWVANMKYACLAVNLPYIKLTLIPSLVAIFLCPLVKLKQGLYILLSTTLGMVIIYFSCALNYKNALNENSLLFLCDKEKSAYVINANGNRTIVVDMRGAGNIKNDMYNMCLTYIDDYVITECNNNALTRLKSTNPYTPITNLYIPENNNQSENYDKFKEFAKAKGINLHYYDTKAEIVIDKTKIYTPDIIENSAFALSTECFGESVALFGSSTTLAETDTTDAEAIITTKAFMDNVLRIDLFPKKPKVFYSNARYTNDYLDALYYKSNKKLYDRTLFLQYGKDGLEEVKP